VSSSNVAEDSVVADPLGIPAEETMYVVAYFNGVTEQVSGLDAARTRLMNPESRIAEAQDAPLGGTYARA